MVEETLHDGKLGGSPTWRCPEPALTWRRPGGPGALTAAGSGEEVVPASDGVHREPSFGGDLTSYAAPFAGAPSRFRAEAHRSAWPDDPGGAREDIGEPSVLVDVAGPGGLDQRIDCSGAVAALAGTGEGPVLACVFGHAYRALVEEARERRPAGEAVHHGLADLALAGGSGALLAQPSLQCDHQRAAALIARAVAPAASDRPPA